MKWNHIAILIVYFTTNKKYLECYINLRSKIVVYIMSTQLMVTSEVTALYTSTNTTISEVSDENEEKSNLVIYISIPVAIAILFLCAVIAVILIRRHKSGEKNTDSEAVYCGNDMSKRKRSIPGIQNQAYCPYNIESKEMNNMKRTDSSQSCGIYRKTSHDSITDLPKVVSYQNINLHADNDLSSVYMNDIDSRDNTNISSYTYVSNVNGGFEVRSDVYYEVTNDAPDYYMFNDASKIAKATERKPKSTSMIDSGVNTKDGKTDAVENDRSVYDHAMAGGATPEMARSEKSPHVSKANENEDRKSPARHRYVNVSNQNYHDISTQSNTRNMYDHIGLADDQSQKHEGGQEYCHLNEMKGTVTRAFPHKYENIIQGDDGNLSPSTNRKHNGGYEDPVGSTPSYFFIEQ